MYRTILVPLDDSEVTASILEQVAVLARGYGAHLLLLTVGLSLPLGLAQDCDFQRLRCGSRKSESVEMLDI